MDDDAIPPLPPIDSDDELDDFHDIDDFDWSQPLPGEDSFDIPGPDILEEPASVRSQYQPHMSFYATYTDSVENNLSQEEIGQRSADVVTYMKRRGLNLAVFLNAIFWGNPICTSRADVQHERTTFMSSKYLKIVLENWWRPPGGAKSGQQVIQDFAVGCTQEVLTAEMNHIAPSMRPDDNPLEHDNLTSVDFEEFGTYLSGTGGAPILWMLLMSLAWGVRQAKENSLKSPFHVIMMIIVMLSYTRSHHRSRIVIVWSIYLKACGLSARAFDALHALGITMSHKWTANAVGKISRSAMERMKKAVREFPWVISHDNLNLPLRVFSQRLHNKSHFISATAATVWILPKSATLPDDINTQYQEQRREGAKEHFRTNDLLKSTELQTAQTHLRAHSIYRILRFLLESPSFKSYKHRSDPLLQPPPPVCQLPCGEENITSQYILETVQIDESSYDGTDQLLNKEYPRQLGFTSAIDSVKIGLKWIIVWIGDQLTVERVRGLAKLRHAEPNANLRMDWVIPMFGWFHLVMAFANSIHSQHLGTSAGVGLRKSFDVLGRKYLNKQETKGIFWHHLDEAPCRGLHD